jgi:RNA recognition motif-containing protein
MVIQEQSVRPKQTEQRFTEAQIREAAEAVLDEIKSSPDTQELSFYRAIFRKSVPFAMRSYFAGYLLKRLLQSRQKHRRQEEEAARVDQDRRHERKRGLSERPRTVPKIQKDEGRQGKEPQERRERAENQEKRERLPREKSPPLPPEIESATLFFGAGKKRRCYQEHVLAILVEDGRIERSQIGEIRSFDNYSFVQIAAQAAEKAIQVLNGFEYRGRKITVSYARKKEEAPFSRREEAGEPRFPERRNESVDDGIPAEGEESYEGPSDSWEEENPDELEEKGLPGHYESEDDQEAEEASEASGQEDGGEEESSAGEEPAPEDEEKQ